MGKTVHKMSNTYVTKLSAYICLLMLVFFVLACSEQNADAPDYDKVHPQTWSNPQFINAEPFHGSEVVTQGTASCVKCHDIDGEGQKDIPGCFKCHFSPDGSKVPEGSDWTHGEEGHMEFEENQSVCNRCHEVERSFGTGPGICHNCHGPGETHVLGQAWLDSNSPQFHGPVPQDECANCHDISQDCSQCHFGSTGSKAPIGSGWLHGNNDGHRDYENRIDTCNQCHTLDRSYGNGPASCHDCHETGTHVLGQAWLDSNSPQFHGDQSQQDCADCHNLSTDCNQCHFGPTGSKAPIGSGWLHGNDNEHEDYENQRATCNQCHTLNRSYGNGPARCHDCHDD